MPSAIHSAHICHLTVLNPAVHSRIFFKEALSQVAAGYRVTVIGQDPSAQPYEREGVQIVPTGTFGRLSRARFSARKKILKLAFDQSADVYQVHSPELLGVAQKLKAARPNARFIYDMHENYAQNILHGGYYPGWVKGWLARRVQKAEANFQSWGDGVMYAEDCFAGLADVEGRTAFVRNKFCAPVRTRKPLVLAEKGTPLMLYTGTIAENWGIFHALDLWAALNRRRPVNLFVAGHTHDKALLARLHQYVSDSGIDHRFSMVEGEGYVPYETVVDLIRQCTFGVAPYALRQNIRDRIPTKFYEFMAFRKPLLFSENPPWNALNARLDFGRPTHWPLSEPQIDALASQLDHPAAHFYQKPLDPAEYRWDAEADNMLALLKTVLSETNS
ncbi:MAG: glycosyltransferase [Bacteroidota bacterium]